jgi:hypothetical protein
LFEQVGRDGRSSSEGCAALPGFISAAQRANLSTVKAARTSGMVGNVEVQAAQGSKSIFPGNRRVPRSVLGSSDYRYDQSVSR